MLTEGDIEQIKENRKQIMRNRLVEITAYFSDGEEDPYTGEDTGETTEETVEVRWSETSQANTQSGIRGSLEDGLTVVEGDAGVTFPVDFDVYNIDKIKHDGIEYKVTNIDARGLGEVNRYECTVKKVT